MWSVMGVQQGLLHYRPTTGILCEREGLVGVVSEGEGLVGVAGLADGAILCVGMQSGVPAERVRLPGQLEIRTTAGFHAGMNMS